MGRVSNEGSYQPADPSQKTRSTRKVMDHFEGWIILRGRGGGKVKGSIGLISLEAFQRAARLVVRTKSEFKELRRELISVSSEKGMYSERVHQICMILKITFD